MLKATSGVAIAGDPGAKAKYNFSLTLSAAANETIEARTQQIIATANGGQKATATLNQTAGDPFIEVTPTTIDVPQDGSVVQVTVDTNSTFTVTPQGIGPRDFGIEGVGYPLYIPNLIIRVWQKLVYHGMTAPEIIFILIIPE